MIWISVIIALLIAFMAIAESRNNQVARTVFLCTVLLIVFLNILAKSTQTTVTIENLKIEDKDKITDQGSIANALEER